MTTKYGIEAPKKRKTEVSETAAEGAAAPAAAAGLRASLTLKTYDPVSGVTLKYRTTKAQEVTRLMQTSLGMIGRKMAGLPDLPPADEIMADAAVVATPIGTEDSVAKSAPSGGKKKKKGKK